MQTVLTSNITVLSVTPEIAVESCKPSAGGLQTSGPVDQLVVAAAMVHLLTPATRDKEIIRWRGVSVLVN